MTRCDSRTCMPAVFLMLLFWTPFHCAAAGEPLKTTDETVKTAAKALHTPRLETPIESAGTGLAPEVSVRVVVNRKGVVSAVEVLQIRPSSTYDNYFRETVENTLLRWRYAPATEDGEPVEVELKWTINFPKRVHGQEDTWQALGWNSQRFQELDPDAGWRRILGLPDKQRLALLEFEAKRATSFLEDKTMRRRESNRFIVFSDAANGEYVEIISRNLEALFNFLEQFLGDRLIPQPEHYKIVVTAFERNHNFSQYKSSTDRVEWMSGFYFPAGMIAVYLEMPTGEALLSVLLHEATHAYVDRHVVRQGVQLPRWLGEGFAEYIGNSRIKKGQLIPGRTPGSQIYKTPYGLIRGDSQQLMTVDKVKAAVRRGEALSVADILAADLRTFYGEDRSLFYSMSWLLVHYLQHGQPGWKDDNFPTLFLYMAEGYPSLEALQEAYGAKPEELGAGFRRYVKKF